MDVLLNILIIGVLSVIFWQDWYMRAIHIVLPVLLFVLGVLRYAQIGLDFWELQYSTGFLILTLVGLYVYIQLRKKGTGSLLEMIGLGDILFLVAVIPFFTPHNFILFFCTGMLFSILSFILIPKMKKTGLVPLAGLLAMYMIGLQCVGWIIGVDLFFSDIQYI